MQAPSIVLIRETIMAKSSGLDMRAILKQEIDIMMEMPIKVNLRSFLRQPIHLVMRGLFLVIYKEDLSIIKLRALLQIWLKWLWMKIIRSSILKLELPISSILPINFIFHTEKLTENLPELILEKI